MENVGALALLLAFCISLYAIVASVAGRLKNKPFLILSGERAVLAVWLLVSTAAGILIYSLMTGDYADGLRRLAHQPRHAAVLQVRGMVGRAGRLAALLELDALHLRRGRRSHQPRQSIAICMPWVVAILSTVQLFFLTLNAFVVSPFQVLALDKVDHFRSRRHGPQSAAAVLGDGDSSADAVSGLRRFRRSVRVRHGFADFESAGRKLDSHDAPLDHRHLAFPGHRQSCSAPPGLITFSAGAATGCGTRLRTLRCCRGSPARLFCTP